MIAIQEARPSPPVGHAGLDHALARAFQLLEAVEAYAEQLSAPELGDIALPPVVGSVDDQAHLQTVAPLYLAFELEAAGLLSAVETLAGIFASGGLEADVGPAAPLLVTIWEGRHQRFAAPERQAFYTRLFGGDGPTLGLDQARNTAFEPLMIQLCEALNKLDPGPGGDAAVRAAAAQLAENLLQRSGGMATFAARDLLTAMHAALTVLKQPQLQAVLGAHSVWTAVQSIGRRYLQTEFSVSAHVTRGRTGMQVLAWLAAVLPVLDGTGAIVSLNDAVIGAGVEWLQASLSLAEERATHGARER